MRAPAISELTDAFTNIGKYFEQGKCYPSDKEELVGLLYEMYPRVQSLLGRLQKQHGELEPEKKKSAKKSK